ncbi:TetR/AcrR family transcriptional regulator [Paenibacillus endoradicis]|uniref:TetR/AcrR family transcriptional regulator n=1 Tax=Paenibacillus endoradicis TaxID=2972487 RepID=UPI002158D1D6|nr:TetR/AcrR family transcriptional regulator [Paenibacillus endoradicis]MCR8655957.1 TetR/AcrR family transcriptional regulator [Paenibacillus endoradicis]MCR8658283.1 TetR/AcrR family transcriptional regulator [Paenibacillus endoradicis]
MPDKKHNDRRVLRTKMIISEALLDVLHYKELEQITVSDITEQANINRSTFYLHYQDKDKLVEVMMKEKLTQLNELIAPTIPVVALKDIQIDEDEPDLFTLAIFQNLSQNERFYRIMFQKNSKQINEQLYITIRESLYLRIAALKMEQKLFVPLDISLDFMTSATIGIIHKWFADKMVYSPRYMSIQLTRIANLGTNKVMGIT